MIGGFLFAIFRAALCYVPAARSVDNIFTPLFDQ
jgi:hypothetical protein